MTTPLQDYAKSESQRAISATPADRAAAEERIEREAARIRAANAERAQQDVARQREAAAAAADHEARLKREDDALRQLGDAHGCAFVRSAVELPSAQRVAEFGMVGFQACRNDAYQKFIAFAIGELDRNPPPFTRPYGTHPCPVATAYLEGAVAGIKREFYQSPAKALLAGVVGAVKVAAGRGPDAVAAGGK